MEGHMDGPRACAHLVGTRRRSARGATGVGLLAAAALAAACDDGPRALVLLHVTGDRSYAHVALTITTTGSVEKRFPDVSFDQSMAFEVGIYLPSTVTGTVAFSASAEGAQC